MKKSVILSAALVLSLSASSAVYADLPTNTVVIGNNAYSIRDLFKTATANSVNTDLAQAKATDIYYTVAGANYSGLSSLATGQNVKNSDISTTFANGIKLKDSTGSITQTFTSNNIQTPKICAQDNYSVYTYVYGNAPDEVLPDFTNIRYNDGTKVENLTVTADNGSANNNVLNKVGKTDVAYTLSDGNISKPVTVTVNVKPISEMKLSEIINESNIDALSTVFGDVYLNNRPYTWNYLKSNLDILKDQIAVSADKQFAQLKLNDLANVTLIIERSNGDKLEFTIDSTALLDKLPEKISEITGLTGFGQYSIPLTSETVTTLKDEICGSQRKVSDFLTDANLDKVAERLSSVTIEGKTYTEDDIKANLDTIKQKICEAVGASSFDDITFANLQNGANARLNFTSGIFGKIFEIQLPSILSK